MNTTYFRKKDEAQHGRVAFDSQSQRFSLSQYNVHGGNQVHSLGSNNQGGETQAHIYEDSQNADSNHITLGDNKQYQQMKVELDLTALYNDINQEAPQPINPPSQQQSKQRKITGTGQFNLTKQSKRIADPHQSSQNTMELQKIVNVEKALRPKANQKYDITPTKNQQHGIAGFLGLKNEELSTPMMEIDQHPSSSEILEVGRKVAPTRKQQIVVKTEDSSYSMKVASLQKYVGMNADNFFEVPVKTKNDSDCDEDMQVEAQPVIPTNDRKKEEGKKSVAKKGAAKQTKKASAQNKKRKAGEISNNNTEAVASEELDEEMPEEVKQGNKKRKLNNVFEKPTPRPPLLGSGFSTNKNTAKQQQPSIIISHNLQIKKEIENSSALYNQKQNELALLHTRRHKLQNAYDEYFDNPNAIYEDNLVLKVVLRTRLHGIQWVIGELADFRVSDKDLQDVLRKNSQKIRVMMPPSNYNAFDNSNRSRLSAVSNSSGNSSGAGGVGILDGFIVVESPTIIRYSNGGQGLDGEKYLTVIGRRVQKYDGTNHDRFGVKSEKTVAIKFSQESHQTV